MYSPARLQHDESIYHKCCQGEYGLEIRAKSICEFVYRNGIFTQKAKVFLNQFGKRLTTDLIRLAHYDGIKLWFTPLLLDRIGTGRHKLSQFDEFEKTTEPGECRIIFHYEIQL